MHGWCELPLFSSLEPECRRLQNKPAQGPHKRALRISVQEAAKQACAGPSQKGPSGCLQNTRSNSSKETQLKPQLRSMHVVPQEYNLLDF